MVHPLGRDITFKSFLRQFKVRYGSLADEMGYSPVHLSRVFNGHRRLTSKFAKSLISCLRESHKGASEEFIRCFEEVYGSFGSMLARLLTYVDD